MLKAMECDAYQGFLNSRPLPPEELADRLKRDQGTIDFPGGR
jgi:EAL domain-containing protein (putative c-di-GMP-specific phosphodiesterase class I)